MAVSLITHDYENEVTKEKLPVVVEFYADWCPKCAMMNDVIENLARRFQYTWRFKKLNIDHSAKAAQDLGIEIVPTFVVYQKGKIMGYTTGVLSEEVLEGRIEEMLRG